MTATLQRIDRITSEGPLGMAEAAKLLGSFRRGRPTHPSTPTRWATKGFRLPSGENIRLETIRIAGRLMTSRAAVLRFLEAMQDPTDNAAPAAMRSPAERRRAAERAGRELEKMGA